MRFVRIATWAITALGLLMAATALLLSLDQVWLLAGIMLIWVGIVKIVVALIWDRIAHLGTNDHQPTPAP
ncbi:MAG: hypothetical protein ACR2OU_00795 [Thermomicrobiales bacterium]